MGSSLRDELLKSGLVDSAKVKQEKRAKYRDEKQRRGRKDAVVSPEQRRAAQARAEKIARDRELNRQRQEKAERNAQFAQIRQLIEVNRLPEDAPEVDFNFTDEKKIKKIQLSEVTSERLARGALAIVKLDGRYELVPSGIANEIRARDPRRVIFSSADRPANEGEDPYEDYPVPDDLRW